MHFFSYYSLLSMLWNEFGVAEIEALWLSCIEIWGACFTSVFSVFSVMAGWIQRCFLCYSFILPCNRQNIAEYEGYWLIGVPIVNP